MADLSTLTREQLLERKALLIRKQELLSQQPQQPTQEQPQETIPQMLGSNLVTAGKETLGALGQLTKGAYYGVPKGIRQAATIPALPIADLIRTLQGEKNIPPLSSLGQMESGVSSLVNRIPEAQTTEDKLLQAVGSFAPFSQMVKPVSLGVNALPYVRKSWPIIKSALTGAGYGGGRAVLEGQPQQAGQEALESAKQFAFWHGGGRLGATLGKPFGRLGPNIGSMVGAGAVGYGTAPEGEREAGGLFGAGLGAISPYEPIKAQGLAQMAVKFNLKPQRSLYEYNANPERAMVKEGLWGVNWDSIFKKAVVRNSELLQERNRLISDVRNRDKRIDLSENKALQPLYDLLVELERDPIPHKNAIKILNENIKSLRRTDVRDLNIDQAYEFIDRVNNLTPSGESVFETKGGSKIKDALRKTYGKVREAINASDITSELKGINRRISDIIALKTAIDNASHRNVGWFRFIPISIALGGFRYGNPILGALGTGAEALKHPSVSTMVGKILGEQYPSISQSQNLPLQPPVQGGLPPTQPPIQPQPAPINPILPTTGKGQTVNTMPTVPESIQKIVRKPRVKPTPTEEKVAPLLPKSIETVSEKPTMGSGKGWIADRGAMPGEPVAVYKNKIAVTEVIDDQHNVLYNVTDNKGNDLGSFPTLEESKIFAEQQLSTPTEGKVGLINIAKQNIDAKGNFIMTGDTLTKELSTRTNQEIIDLMKWSREQSPHTQRNIEQTASAELRSRGVPVDEIKWQQKQLSTPTEGKVINKELEPIAEIARQYKSADEFIKAKVIPNSYEFGTQIGIRDLKAKQIWEDLNTISGTRSSYNKYIGGKATSWETQKSALRKLVIDLQNDTGNLVQFKNRGIKDIEEFWGRVKNKEN